MPIALCVLSVFFMVAGSDEPVIGMLEGTALESWLHKAHIGNSVVFGLATGVFSGLVIWFFAVYIPEHNKRRILRTNLSSDYNWFRERVLGIFLTALRRDEEFKRSECPQIKDLQHHQKFKEFFGENKSSRWYAVARSIGNDADLLQQILQEMELLSREAMHVRNNYNIQDETIHAFLGRLSAMALGFEKTNPYCDYNYRKSLMGFLWGIFSQWSFVDGQHEEDPIQKMIDRI